MKNKIKTKQAEYQKSIKSNAQLQFDIGCKAIKEMGEEYRKLSASISFEDRFNNIPLQNLEQLKSYLCDNFDMKYLKINEEKWLLATAIACNLPINNDIMKTIYGQNIWDEIPQILNDENFSRWKEKYKSSLDDNNLTFFLKKSIEYKNKIIHNHKFGCYHCYSDKKLVNIIAQKFSMPSEEELHTLGRLPYWSINDLAIDYMKREIQKQDFCPAMNGGFISPQPTNEEKQKGYSAKSYEENIKIEMQKKHELYDRYYRNKK